MEKFDKLLAKKMKDKKSSMSDTERDAKMSVLDHVKSMAQDMMKDKLGGLKKVEVASDSPEGLKEGLDKAKALMGAKAMMGSSDDEGSPEEEAKESPEEEAAEEGSDDESPEMEEQEGDSSEDMSEEELEEKLRQLLDMKERMEAKKRI